MNPQSDTRTQSYLSGVSFNGGICTQVSCEVGIADILHKAPS